MKNLRVLSFILVFTLGWASTSMAQTLNLSSCADYLDTVRRRADDLQSQADDLRRKARDAADAAMKADTAQQELQSKQDNADSRKRAYELCRQFPEVYDVFRDGCSSEGRRLRDAQNEVNQAKEELADSISSLKDALGAALSEKKATDSVVNTVNTAMKNAQETCQSSSEPRPPIKGVSLSNQRMCTTVQNARRSLGVETAMNLCKQYLPEAECAACTAAP